MERKNGAFFLNLPPTEAGGKLKLTDEQKEIFQVVYKKIKGQNRAELLELWNPEKEYGEDCYVTYGTSIYNGTRDFIYGEKICNMVNTANDHHSSNASWIAVLKIVYEVLFPKDRSLLDSCCVTPHYYYNSNNYSREVEMDYPCGGRIEGSHILLIDNGGIDNNRYILPLCHRHNMLSGCYMKIGKQTIHGLKIAYEIVIN